MGQQANNGGRHASLDDKKLRSAGRADQRARADATDAPAKGKTGGAFGKNDHANPNGGNLAAGQGGGGGFTTRNNSATKNIGNSRSARKSK